MSEKHTPGPWHVVRYGDGDSLVICNDLAGNSRVAFMAVPGARCLGDRRTAWARIKAEARLIAAAPELLEALEDALVYLRFYRENALENGHPEWIATASAAVDRAESAAAKARAR